jgi:hypothetical protein
MSGAERRLLARIHRLTGHAAQAGVEQLRARKILCAGCAMAVLRQVRLENAPPRSAAAVTGI